MERRNEPGPAKILIVEDEVDIAETLVDGLAGEGHLVTHAKNGEIGGRHLANDWWNLVILDLMLPDIPGEALLNFLTQRPDYPAVLVLTARDSTQDKVSLFRQGCDDYLTKPFLFEELCLRVNALLRRAPKIRSSTYRYSDIELDVVLNRLMAGDKSIALTPEEAAICRLLIREPLRVLSRRELFQGVWGLKAEPSADYLGIHLFNLRKKMAQLDRADWLQTVRSAGFVFCDPSVRRFDVDREISCV